MRDGENMKLPPRDGIDTLPAAGRLGELSSALRAGRLVGLLKGKALTRRTIEELARPESALALKAILTDHLFPESDRVDPPANASLTYSGDRWSCNARDE